MITLVPAWARYYNEFWEAVRIRNLWLIKLRYGAVLMLFAFLTSSEFLLGITFTEDQINSILVINLSILFYNFLLHWLRRYIKGQIGQFNPLHFSLVQMLLDLCALFLLVYYTGGIETPLFMLFVFHMIIGSMILPGTVIYSMAVLLILIFGALISSEYYNFIPHHSIGGLLEYPLYNNFNFIVSYFTVFSFVIIISVFLANRIANQLYIIEQKLVESIEKLKAAETEKQRYVMGVVHEIKTPLAAVHSYLDVILHGFLGEVDSNVSAKLCRARTRSAEAIKLTNDVLKVSKLRLLDEISQQVVNIPDIIGQILDGQKDNIESKKLLLKTKYDLKNNGKIVGDTMLLEIAFSNIISNAIKYGNENGIVEIILKDNETGMEIEVSDNGIGIPELEIKKIFNDFYRASNIKQKGYEGTGLGLSIIKQIIERHGGKVSILSPSKLGNAQNPGISLRVFLPYAKKIRR